MSAATAAPVAAVAAAAPIPMFSQRGFTCGPDSLFTVLFESDTLRPFFEPLLARSPARLLASKEELKRALGLAIQRYQKMSVAPRTGPPLLRSESTNAGEAKAVLNIVSECGPDNIGMRPGILKKVIHEILPNDALDVLGSKHLIQVASLPDVAVKPAAIKDDTVFALIFELDFFKPIPAPMNRENEYENFMRRYGAAVNLSRKTTTGHIVAFFKRDGAWYFADNEVGWLHKMTDQSFVPDHLLPAIKDAMGSTAPFSPLVLAVPPADADPDRTHLRYTLIAGDAHYTGTDTAGEFDTEYGYLGAGEVHVLMKPTGGRRRATRRARKTRRLRRHA